MTLKISNYFIKKNGLFPNNEKLPLLLYQQAFEPLTLTPELIEKTLAAHGWHNLWRNGIYSYSHYHSNTHEVLAIYSGACSVEIGGDASNVLEIQKGDVPIIPVGVAHKNQQSTADFKCIGGYPFNIEYNIKLGQADEHPQTDNEINHTPLPATDPVFGANGALLTYWKLSN